MSWRPQYRSSKFRNVYGKAASREHCFDGIPITKNVHDNHFCAVNARYLAIVTESAGGGSFLVIPLEQVGIPIGNLSPAAVKCPNSGCSSRILGFLDCSQNWGIPLEYSCIPSRNPHPIPGHLQLWDAPSLIPRRNFAVEELHSQIPAGKGGWEKQELSLVFFPPPSHNSFNPFPVQHSRLSRIPRSFRRQLQMGGILIRI
ncbi:hypothetical protein IHE44_0002916 [Lamprotornis superbus]|uniref:DUF1899 domain-containing protein n=1 Tax=Lamprotornis superbus TaxID=245042 RepID=A0A835TPK2_9PASS|nr:hypothetical protein IHE44_0002916 [Lamprotornis superbus]